MCREVQIWLGARFQFHSKEYDRVSELWDDVEAKCKYQSLYCLNHLYQSLLELKADDLANVEEYVSVLSKAK